MKWNTRSKGGGETPQAAGTAEQAPAAVETAEKAGKERKRGASRVRLFFFALILGAALAFCAVGYLESLQISAPAITSSLLKEELKYVKDLVTVEYRYTNADKAEFPGRVLFGQNIPFTGKSFIVSYDGVIKYGVDLSAVEIRVSEAAKTVTVTVPRSKVISHEMPEEGFRALDEKNGLFNRIQIDDVTEFRRTQKDAMEAKAVEMGLPRQAQEQSGNAIEALLRATPGMDEYQLNIKYE